MNLHRRVVYSRKVPSEEDLRINVDLDLRINEDDALDLSTETEVLQERIMTALRVSPEQLRQIREGSLRTVSMGCSVSAPAPCPECSPEDTPICLYAQPLRSGAGDGDVYPGVEPDSESHPQRDRIAAVLAPELAESLPIETRDRIIREYLENSRGRPALATAGGFYLADRLRVGPSPWYPEYGSNVRRLAANQIRLIDISLVSEGGHPFKIIQPLPPLSSWCVVGAIVRRWDDGQDYSVINIGKDLVWLRENSASPHPLTVVCDRNDLARNWQSEWRPHPLPPTKWERLMED